MTNPRFAATLVAISTFFGAALAVAQDFPNRPIRVVSNLAAGATPDIMVRIMSPAMTSVLGQPIMMDYKPGASGRIAFESVAKAPPDGYTILVSNQNLATARAFMKDLSFDPVTDLPPISIAASTPLLLAVNNSRPWKTFADMIAHAKSNPGKVFMGNGGVQTTHNLFMLAINQKYGVDLTGVPYKGGSPQMWLAVYQNDTQMSMFTEAAVISNAAKVTPIAVTGEHRLASFPNVPTFLELGLPQVIGVEYMIHVPKGTPKPVVDKLSAAINAAIQKDEVKDALSKVGLRAVGASAAEAQQKHAEYNRFFSEMAQKFGIQPE